MDEKLNYVVNKTSLKRHMYELSKNISFYIKHNILIHKKTLPTATF
jgi:hypothetical protein